MTSLDVANNDPLEFHANEIIILTRRPLLLPLSFLFSLYYFLRGYWQRRWLSYRGKTRFYGGHPSVTRSLIQGLDALSIRYKLDPIVFPSHTTNVLVLSSTKALHYAIHLKKSGRIRRLFVGPNIPFNCTYNSDEAIDGFLNHTEEAFLRMRVKPSPLTTKYLYPVGVDTDLWQPSDAVSVPCVLFFIKYTNPDIQALINQCTSFVVSLGFNVIPLYFNRKNRYIQSDFLSCLQKSQILVGFPKPCGESQGIAWSESWSANVPTLIYQGNSYLDLEIQRTPSSAPFLSQQTGDFFEGFTSFQETFSYWHQRKTVYSPRDWVLSNMSDSVTTLNLLTSIFHSSTSLIP